MLTFTFTGPGETAFTLYSNGDRGVNSLHGNENHKHKCHFPLSFISNALTDLAGRHHGDEVTVSEEKLYGLFAAFQVMSVMFAHIIVLSASLPQLLQVRVDRCIRPGVILFDFSHHFHRGQPLDIKNKNK